jgi:hypothetical protein
LFRLTSGLPKRELRLAIQEANECEAALMEDIKNLEESLTRKNTSTDDPSKSLDTLNHILDSPLTPLDRYWTIAALLGRLRKDMALPSIPSVQGPKHNDVVSTPTIKMVSSEEDDDRLMEELLNAAGPFAKAYFETAVSTDALLAVWKKISSNRAAFVFKRPVKSEEAPGYAERIHYPMDLSLIRKRIITNNIQTFSDLHAALGLITHNCVKYNGA